MKKMTTGLMLLLGQLSFAQIQIVSADLPHSGDVLYQENATWTGNWNLEESGANLTWNVGSTNVILLGSTTTTDCMPMSGAPIAYQFFFGSPLDQEHFSAYHTVTALPQLPLDQLPLPIPITLEDAYAFYQNRSDRYALTGFGLSISGFPTGAAGDPVDVIYPLPLTYGLDQTNDAYFNYQIPTLGSYTTAQTRRTQVLAYGTMNYFGTNYPVIKVKSTVNADDILVVDQFGLNLPFARPEAIEYKWLTPGINVPLLQINTTAGAISGVLVYDATSASLMELNDVHQVQIFPNPSSDLLFANIANGSMYSIVDLTGRVVLSGLYEKQNGINVQSLPNGNYFFQTDAATIQWIKN
ncbi:MAG: T9SS type A sorting domain-containing protein [Bacteroidetes bacterium]|nr:T9SS type A sorting domain-containing protein [Bacteroidota bacterium]